MIVKEKEVISGSENTKRKLRAVILLVALWIGGQICCLLISVLLASIHSPKGWYMAFMAFVSMLSSFALLPYFITRHWMPELRHDTIGIKKINRIDAICFLTTGAVISLIFINQNRHDMVAYIGMFMQQLSVSISEEIFVRGITIFLLSKIFKSKILVVLISGFMFGILLHTGDNFITNLCVRVPADIALAAVFLRTKSIYPSMQIHLIFNMICVALL